MSDTPQEPIDKNVSLSPVKKAIKTKKELIEEILRCGKDPVYFLRTYGKIKHAEKGLLSFKLFPYQEDILRAYTKHRKNIIVKGRQLRNDNHNCWLHCLVHIVSAI
jgi:transposase